MVSVASLPALDSFGWSFLGIRIIRVSQFIECACLAELVDAPDSKSGSFTGVRVQVSGQAPFKSQIHCILLKKYFALYLDKPIKT
jgi:hypothetical protein